MIELTGEDPQPQRHQMVDLPVIKPLVTEYRLHELECEHCGEKTRASLPKGVSPKCYGVRLAAFVALLSAEYRQSHRQIQTLLSQVFKIEISSGTINGMRQEVNAAVETATTEAMAFVQQQPVGNCDETGFKQQNKDGENPLKRKAWLWVMVTPLVSVFIGKCLLVGCLPWIAQLWAIRGMDSSNVIAFVRVSQAVFWGLYRN